MAEELKACPFCSCTDISEVTINLILEQRHRRFKVYCKACQCRTSEHKTRKEARIYWNTRAQLPSQGGEAVATDAFVPGSLADLLFQLGEKGIGVSGGTHGDHWMVSPLYTHPADQVAEPDAELVALLRSKFPRIDPCQPVPLDEKAHCCEYTIYVERERLHRLIDAKLASLEVKP